MRAVEVLPGDVVCTRTGRAVRVDVVATRADGWLVLDGSTAGGVRVTLLAWPSTDVQVSA